MLLDHCYCPYIRTILKYVHHFANIAYLFIFCCDSYCCHIVFAIQLCISKYCMHVYVKKYWICISIHCLDSLLPQIFIRKDCKQTNLRCYLRCSIIHFHLSMCSFLYTSRFLKCSTYYFNNQLHDYFNN